MINDLRRAQNEALSRGDANEGGETQRLLVALLQRQDGLLDPELAEDLFNFYRRAYRRTQNTGYHEIAALYNSWSTEIRGLVDWGDHWAIPTAAGCREDNLDPLWNYFRLQGGMIIPFSCFRSHLPRCIGINDTRDLEGRRVVLDLVDDLWLHSSRHFEAKGSIDIYGIAGLLWHGGIFSIETEYPMSWIFLSAPIP